MTVSRALEATCLALCVALPLSPAVSADEITSQLRALPPPPPVIGLTGFPIYRQGRAAYLHIVKSEAERTGLPPAVADAVAYVESGYRPTAFGGVGEIGLMQIRPQTAAMLGYKGDTAGLYEPQTNVEFG